MAKQTTNLYPLAPSRSNWQDCRCGRERGCERRAFLKSAAAAIGAFQFAGAASLLTATCGEDREFAPPAPDITPIGGLIDVHLHCGVDLPGRAVDDKEFFQFCKSSEIAAVVLKDHAAPTADRAWLARTRSGVKVFGGIVLNASVGGISSDAVSWMSRTLGGYGRFVWFPTFDADHHLKHHRIAREGIGVLAADGKLLPAVYDVLRICTKQRLVVNTGHLAPVECLTVIAAARDVGVDRIIVTHVESDIPNLSLEQMKQAARMGAKLELIPRDPLTGLQSKSEVTPLRQQLGVRKTVDAIRAIGAENFVLGTDLDLNSSPSSGDALQSFAAVLMAEGITRGEIMLMGREVPGALLMG